MDDSISRQAATDIVSGYSKQLNGYIGAPNDSEVYAYARGLLLSIERNINAVPLVQPDSCDGCKYENADDGVLVPCGFCKRSHPDNYERRTDG